MPDIVTCLLVHHDKLLILKRSEKVRTYRGMWGGVAGYVEPDEYPVDTAYKEIKEEVGLDPDEVTLIKEGVPFSFIDEYQGETYNWTVYPFVFQVEKKDKIQIDWEHSECAWISPQEISHYTTVPHLKDVVSNTLR